ncbi:SapC family protein [Spartinivicinus poritis]|uniref:SapC family protein n=1 Tax=Spartinivicinus poritis TaxID=2994640 RepID=A0ABT5UA67_9GAMM|nr:SapC family protein [Spartinivicinus sp. A2-2]MDE1463255.1 SapC family protein [Spartinivicinus sp. A2-2]
MNQKKYAFYQHIVPLRAVDHHQLELVENNQYGFAKSVNAVYLADIEFNQACKFYPIVFVQHEDQIQPSALLGLEHQVNLFVNDKGIWTVKYIPAYIRRYPFILADVPENNNELVVCIDDAAPMLTTAGDTKGKGLFTEQGDSSEYLQSKVDFLKHFQQASGSTQAFCQKLKTLDLFEPMNAQINMHKGDNLSLTGFMVVSKKKLQTLPESQLRELITTNYMQLIYEHLSSLSNLSVLVDKTAALRTIRKAKQANKVKAVKVTEAVKEAKGNKED